MGAGDYMDYDWAIKADADAVFFPEKLVPRIHLLPVGPAGAFLANCEGVKYGFFGNLEVISKTAMSIFINAIDTCKHKTVANWKVGIEHGKYGPMGEDLFAEMCMRKNGVEHIDAFDITKDGCCAAKRPGNEKKTRSGSQTVHPPPTQQCILTRLLRSTLTAWMQPRQYDQYLSDVCVKR